jgi:hypothetical protein
LEAGIQRRWAARSARNRPFAYVSFGSATRPLDAVPVRIGLSANTGSGDHEMTDLKRTFVRTISEFMHRFFTDDIVSGMEVLVGPFTAPRLLDLINNDRVRASIRRSVPQHNAVYVDKKSVVVLVVQDKKQLATERLIAIQNERCPGTAYFVVDSGAISSAAALLERIISCAEALSIAPGKTSHETRMIKGKRTLIIGEPRKSKRAHLVGSRMGMHWKSQNGPKVAIGDRKVTSIKPTFPQTCRTRFDFAVLLAQCAPRQFLIGRASR